MEKVQESQHTGNTMDMEGMERSQGWERAEELLDKGFGRIATINRDEKTLRNDPGVKAEFIPFNA